MSYTAHLWIAKTLKICSLPRRERQSQTVKDHVHTRGASCVLCLRLLKKSTATRRTLYIENYALLVKSLFLSFTRKRLIFLLGVHLKSILLHLFHFSVSFYLQGEKCTGEEEATRLLQICQRESQVSFIVLFPLRSVYFFSSSSFHSVLHELTKIRSSRAK